MGNFSSSAAAGGRRHGSRRHNPPPPPQPPANQPQPEISANRYVFAAASPYPSQYPNPGPNQAPYYHYPGYYPPPNPPVPVPLPMPYDHHPRGQAAPAGRYPCQRVPLPPQIPYVEHQKAVTIRNDVNLKKETLRLQPDEENLGRFLVSFTFDATVSGRITIVFFAKEDEEFNLVAEKEDIFPPVTMNFEQGLGQTLLQPSGTGIDFSKVEEADLFKEGEVNFYPLAVKAEAFPHDGADGNPGAGAVNAQITKAVFEKDRDEYRVRVTKQILQVNGMRYELQEIYGIGNTIEDGDVDAKDSGKECVICLSEPRDTTVLPCRHMCMCSGCAKVLRFQTNRCPICRQPVERLLEIKVKNGTDE